MSTWTARACTAKGCEETIPWPDDDPEPPMCVPCWDAATDHVFGLTVAWRTNRYWSERNRAITARDTPEQRARRLSNLHRIRRYVCRDCGNPFESRATRQFRCTPCRMEHKRIMNVEDQRRRRERVRARRPMLSGW